MEKCSNERKGKEKKKMDCTKTNIWSTMIFSSPSQSNTLKGLLSHLNQGCTEVKILSGLAFLTGVTLKVHIQ